LKRAAAIVTASVIALLALGVALGQGQSPLILIYSGFTPQWGEELADLIRSDDRFDADIQIVEEREVYETVVNFPRVQAAILCPITRVQASLEDISNMTVAFFMDGGAIIGMGDVCTTRYAPGMDETVFSITGNRSLRTLTIDDRKVFEYLKKEVIDEINGGLPSQLYLEGYLAFYSANPGGKYVAIPTDGTRHILYEGENNAPLVVAYESPSGGSSVAFPGLTVQENQDRGNYYGYVVERPEFRELFLNSLAWAIENSPRYQRLSGIADEALEEEVSRRAELAEEAENLRKRIERRRLMRLAVVWAVGIVVCLVIGLKLVVVSDGAD